MADAMALAAQSEALFALEAFKRGWEVAKPYHHSQSYDFCIRRDGKTWETVQVKSAYLVKSKSQVKLRREYGSYEKGDFDWLFVVCPDGRMYFIPYRAVAKIKANFRVDGEQYQEFRLDQFELSSQ